MNNLEVIIGESVSATTADTVTAPANEKQNSLNNAPVSPAAQADGHVGGNQHDGHRQDRPTQFPRRHQRGLQYAFAFFLDMSVDVFHHDNRVIHHQPNRQHQRQQGQQVDGA